MGSEMISGRRTGMVRHFLNCMSLAFVLFTAVAGHAATSCNTQGGITTVGLEWIAQQCIPEGANDGTSIYYINNALECNGTSVTLFAPYGDTQAPPGGLINYLRSNNYRVFRNKEGSHIVAVHRYYTGLIDGKDMDNYPAGGVYTDVFKEGFILPSPAPNCQGGDHNAPPCEVCAASTNNISTGRLSHSQPLFAVKSLQPLSLHISLYYRTLPSFAPSAIGSGWSHTYEMALQAGANSSMVFWSEGVRRVYTLNGSTFSSQKGDYSTLVRNADSTYTLTEKDGLVRHFNSSGKITSVVDRNGNALTFTYSGDNLASVTDVSGRTAVFSYSGSILTKITDPKGNEYNLAYASGSLSGVIYPDGAQWGYGYGSNGLMASKTEPEGTTAQYSYDSGRRLTSATDAAGKSRSFTYAASASTGKVPDVYPLVMAQVRETVFVEKDGSGWSYYYDGLTEQLRSKTDPLGNAYTYAYDSQGNLVSKNEPGIGTTTYTYDNRGNVLSVRNPLNETTSFTYNTYGQLLTISGAPGNYVVAYDTRGNPTAVTNPAGETISAEYDPRGNITRILTAKGLAYLFGYDSANNLTSFTDPSGAITSFAYDANGNITTVTDALAMTTFLEYDGQNRLIMITDPLGNLFRYGYDRKGNLSSQTDANSNSTVFQYNHQNQLTDMADALNQVTRFAYSDSGCPSCTSGVDQLISLTDAKNQQTSFGYDNLGRLLTKTDPLSRTTHYSYGPLEMPTSRTDANGATTQYTYDALQRLTGKTYPDGSSMSFTYDSRGNILTASNDNISYTFAYDAASRLASVSDSRGYSITYEYDASGNRTRIAFAPGTADERVISYGYDGADRIQAIASPSGTFTFGYDQLNRRTSLAYPNGVATSYAYDDAGRLTGLSHSGVASFTYTHDNVGNRTSRISSSAESYMYDKLYRLINVASSTKPEAFVFDPVGNRENGPGHKDTAYLYNNANQMITGRQLQYVYDNNGNQVSRTIPGATDKSFVMGWNHENRLVSVEKSKGAETKSVTFKYDPFGRRIEKRISTVIGGVASTSTYTYIYDDEDIVLELLVDDSGTVKTHYVHGPGIDEPLALQREGNFSYCHADGLGSIVALTDSSRNVIQRYEYDAFGMVRPATGFRNAYAYTGREWDSEAGLYFYRARYYDPMAGRFVSKDPIGFNGGDVNLYGYVQNNTMNWIDPLGNERKEPFNGIRVTLTEKTAEKMFPKPMPGLPRHAGPSPLPNVFKLVEQAFDLIGIFKGIDVLNQASFAVWLESQKLGCQKDYPYTLYYGKYPVRFIGLVPQGKTILVSPEDYETVPITITGANCPSLKVPPCKGELWFTQGYR